MPRARFTRTMDVVLRADIEPEASAAVARAEQLGFALRFEGALSPAECAALRAAAAPALRPLDGEFLPTQRGGSRALLRCEALALALWRRLAPSICEAFRGARPFGFGCEGTWRPTGLNPVLRVSRAVPGDAGFAPHRDGNFVERAGRRSALTLLVHLGGTGGATVFYEAAAPRLPGASLAAELAGGYSELGRVAPKEGAALVFPHAALHAGEAPQGAPRWSLRTDVLFEGPSSGGGCAAARRMTELYRSAIDLEAAGEVAGASALYERALSLRQCAAPGRCPPPPATACSTAATPASA